jgi:ribonuclease HII
MPQRGDDPRPQSLLELERGLWGRGLVRVAGVDEVGRGPLAGPVVAAAVILPPGTFVEGVRDSKRLSPSRRSELSRRIWETALAVGLGGASVREIERDNIACATARAMGRALSALPISPDFVLVDGRPVETLGWPHQAVIGGDATVHSIACASVVAKVIRDRLMVRLAHRYPGYGWERNAGYGTPAHLEALRVRGPTRHHRRTFRGVCLDEGLEEGGEGG